MHPYTETDFVGTLAVAKCAHPSCLISRVQSNFAVWLRRMAKAKRKETTPLDAAVTKGGTDSMRQPRLKSVDFIPDQKLEHSSVVRPLVKNTSKNQEFKFRPKNELRDIP